MLTLQLHPNGSQSCPLAVAQGLSLLAEPAGRFRAAALAIAEAATTDAPALPWVAFAASAVTHGTRSTMGSVAAGVATGVGHLIEFEECERRMAAVFTVLSAQQRPYNLAAVPGLQRLLDAAGHTRVAAVVVVAGSCAGAFSNRLAHQDGPASETTPMAMR